MNLNDMNKELRSVNNYVIAYEYEAVPREGGWMQKGGEQVLGQDPLYNCTMGKVAGGHTGQPTVFYSAWPSTPASCKVTWQPTGCRDYCTSKGHNDIEGIE